MKKATRREHLSKIRSDALPSVQESKVSNPPAAPFTSQQLLNEAESYILAKLLKQGEASLTAEELAATFITPNFARAYKEATGREWGAEKQLRAMNSMKKCQLSLPWMSRCNDPQFKPLFLAALKGDITKMLAIFRSLPKSVEEHPNQEDALHAYDETKKTLVHLAAREGHGVMLEMLLNKGCSPNVRDRLLQTPLHLASESGKDATVNALIAFKADLAAKDVGGRTAAHFAACSVSVRVLSTLVQHEPDLILISDNYGRTPLHYAIWNNSSKELDIIRFLLENGAEVDALDCERRTALHYAAEGARAKAIPLLLQHNASLTLRDGKYKRTAAQLAANHHIKELLIVYSSGKFKKPTGQDLYWMGNAVSGTHIGENTLAFHDSVPQVNLSKVKHSPSPKKGKYQKKDEVQALIKRYQHLLIPLLTKVQEYGVENSQHLRKPYLYTGTWLEGVESVEELLSRLTGISSQEVAMRIFNVLVPYAKPLPHGEREKEALGAFFEEQKWEPASDIYQGKVSTLPARQARREQREQSKAQDNFPQSVQEQENTQPNEAAGAQEQPLEASKPEEDAGQIQELKQLVNMLTQKNSEKDAIIEKMEKDLTVKTRQTFEYQKQLENKEEEQQIAKLKLANSRYQQELQEMKQNLKTASALSSQKEAAITSLKKELTSLKRELRRVDDLQQKEAQIEQLKRQLQREKQHDSQLRFKAGQAFMQTLAANKQKLEKQGAALLGTIATKVKSMNSLNVSFNDDKALLRVLKRAQEMPPSLIQRLKAADDIGAGYISVSKFVKVLNQLHTSPQDTLAVLRFAGVSSDRARDTIRIDKFIEILRTRPDVRDRAEYRLMVKMSEAFREKGLALQEAYKFFDLDANKELSLPEFKAGLETLKIPHTKRDLHDLFSVFDSANRGTIALQQFLSRLQEVERVERGETPQVQISDMNSIDELKQDSIQQSVGGYSAGAGTPGAEQGRQVKIGVDIKPGRREPQKKDLTSKTAKRQKDLIELLLKKSEEDRKEFTGIINIAQEENSSRSKVEEGLKTREEQKADRKKQPHPVPSKSAQTVFSQMQASYKPKVEPRVVKGKLILQVVRATGCIDLGALKPSGYYLELSTLTAARKTGADIIETKVQNLQGEVSTGMLNFNEAIEYDINGMDANTLPKHLYIKVFAVTQSEGFGDREDVFMGECCFPWLRTLQKQKEGKQWAIETSFKLTKGNRVLTPYNISGHLEIKAKIQSTAALNKDLEEVKQEEQKEAVEDNSESVDYFGDIKLQLAMIQKCPALENKAVQEVFYQISMPGLYSEEFQSKAFMVPRPPKNWLKTQYAQKFILNEKLKPSDLVVSLFLITEDQAFGGADPVEIGKLKLPYSYWKVIFKYQNEWVVNRNFQVADGKNQNVAEIKLQMKFIPQEQAPPAPVEVKDFAPEEQQPKQEEEKVLEVKKEAEEEIPKEIQIQDQVLKQEEAPPAGDVWDQEEVKEEIGEVQEMLEDKERINAQEAQNSKTEAQDLKKNIVVEFDKVVGTLDLASQKPQKCWSELSWKKGQKVVKNDYTLDNYSTSQISLKIQQTSIFADLKNAVGQFSIKVEIEDEGFGDIEEILLGKCDLNWPLLVQEETMVEIPLKNQKNMAQGSLFLRARLTS